MITKYYCNCGRRIDKEWADELAKCPACAKAEIWAINKDLTAARAPDLLAENEALKAENERLRAALSRLADAAESFSADQSGATDPRCGLVQPITVEEGEELNAARCQAREAMEAGNDHRD